MSIRQHRRTLYVTSENFDRMVIQSPTPVLVNFETPWSKRMVPLLGGIADMFAKQVRVVRVNIAADPDLAARFKIRAVPTLLLFKNGIPVEFIVGTVPARFILETVRKVLGIHPKTIKPRQIESGQQWPWTWYLVPESTSA